MEILRTRGELEAYRHILKTVAFVPTMGALHAGHLSLIHLAQRHAQDVIVSIFVNPTQFGPTEDFDRYPRQLETDLALLKDIGVSAVFCPTSTDIYPHGIKSSTRVSVPELGKRYCGVSRPHFFEGVCGIVLRLFHLVRPHYAVFGEKDFQQVRIIEQMIEDLFLPIQIIRGAILREPDGLAMSSRNRYLSVTERALAKHIPDTLAALTTPATHDTLTALLAAKQTLSSAGITIDYLTLVEDSTLDETATPGTGTRFLFAGYVGPTRLIDNMAVTRDFGKGA